jgi:hypothetical protein
MSLLFTFSSCRDESLQTEEGDEGVEAAQRTMLMQLNQHVYSQLTVFKNKIDEHFDGTNSWDHIKKFSNDYELLCSSLNKYPCVAKISPPSRSYFKLWEILHILNPDFHTNQLKTAHLAEGPGGFIESINDWVAKFRFHTHIESHGITLISSNRTVPQWKISKNKMNKGNIHLHAGADGTGDLYNIGNILHFVDSVGRHTCDIVTADGGFDLQGNFNHQEDILHSLLLREVYAALLLQKEGGMFVMKLFDCYYHDTMNLLYVLYCLYDKVLFIKPHSSRPANSEKYVVCQGYRASSPKKEELLAWLYATIEKESSACLVTTIPFLEQITQFNVQYGYRQILHIYKTLTFIDIIQKHQPKEFVQSVILKQYLLCKKWCEGHSIPHKLITFQGFC